MNVSGGGFALKNMFGKGTQKTNESIGSWKMSLTRGSRGAGADLFSLLTATGPEEMF